MIEIKNVKRLFVLLFAILLTLIVVSVAAKSVYYELFPVNESELMFSMEEACTVHEKPVTNSFNHFKNYCYKATTGAEC